MKITALITEYNPFHNGHAYHIEQARRISGADFIVVVMSGNFVQRGEPAIFDKSLRAEMALRCGADLVLELPARFSCGSAEYFAEGAVSLLNGLGCVDFLCFGSEAGTLSLLSEIAAILAEEPETYRSALQNALKAGNNFPAARESALAEILCGASKQTMCEAASAPFATCSKKKRFPFNAAQLHKLLKQPNNILGIEYLKALKKSGSSITPITIQRIGSHYHDTKLNSQFTSATALRQQICEQYIRMETSVLQGDFSASEQFHTELSCTLSPYLPQDALAALMPFPVPICADDFSQMLHYRLLTAADWHVFADCFDVPEDLARRIFTMRYEFTTFTEFTVLLQTRNYTAPSVRRALLHILLQFPAEPQIRAAGYARILGFRKNAAALLHIIKKHGQLPLLSKTAAAPSLLAALPNEQNGQLFSEDIRSSELYMAVSGRKNKKTGRSEFTRPVVVV